VEVLKQIYNNKDCSFDIKVVDNFFTENEYNEINAIITRIKYPPLHTAHAEWPDKHIWFSAPVDDKLQELIRTRANEKLKTNITKVHLCSYTLLTKVPNDKREIHDDYETEDKNWQCIIFINGTPSADSGISFYGINEDGTGMYLNSSIGFQPNRIVFWRCNMWHCPLNYRDEFKSRHSIIGQFKVEE
jgi:hypothetical protein